ncbi:zinc finger protein 436-like [Toxorhynchites rutilus septentrionalis]|uniref:zinc finger protein 436-like n=1 Tax=Toxorhynchites rutilus septentrionalis TaxID=329112 RepID=UPI0024793EC0|nr:zinc finger protein 436-like [Toxorhynchites rutilus septentrionalis]
MSKKLEDYLSCCRLCLEWETKDLIGIFDTNLVGENVTLQVALHKTTGIDCQEGDHLPARICKQCLTRLQDAHNFIAVSCYNHSLLESLKREALENTKHSKNIPKVENQKAVNYLSVTITDFNNCDHKEEMLEIERLENGSDGYLAEDTGSDEEENHSKSPGNEDPTDAVDFILQTFQNEPKKPAPRRQIIKDPERRHQCEVCDKSFQRKSNLVDHLRLHANVKLFACSYCDAAFVQAGNLKSHLRKHTLEKPYGCDVCGKSYTQSSALKTHMRSHTNTRNYICDVCQKGFTNSSDLNKHKITHSDLRYFTCVLCINRFFAQKIHLKKHLHAFHAEENFEDLLREGTLKEGVRINGTGAKSRKEDSDSD